MSERTFKIPGALRPALRALARVICPPDAQTLGLIEDIVDHVEGTLDAFPPHLRVALLAGAAVMDVSAVFSLRRPGKRLSALSQADADAWFGAWWHSPVEPLPQLPKGLKAVIALAYYEHPQVRQRLEYHPEAWIAKVARRRVERFADAIREHEQQGLAPNPLLPRGEDHV